MKPEDADQKVHDAAAKAFAHHAAEARARGGRTRSLWARRIEPWVLAIAVAAFMGWALVRVFVSR
ncbi:MAG: hypothetical protein JNK82_09845 [Myxococcaceae bacterium]|nr:hypothetical protein [Myxococcaceae bacterium]